MPYWNGSLSNVYNRIADWLTYSADGNNVSDLALDLIKRGELSIWNERDWDFLRKTQSLSLNASRQVSMPSDFGRVVQVYHDDDGDGYPDFFYFQDDADTYKRYTLTQAFARATGAAWTMTFTETPSTAPKLDYIIDLPEITDYTTEYSIFPESLLLLAGQKCHIEDKGLRTNSDNAILNQYLAELQKLERVSKNRNANPRKPLRDTEGNEVITDGYSLNGQFSSTGQAVSRYNSELRV